MRGSRASMWRRCRGSRVTKRARERCAVVFCVARRGLFLVWLRVVVVGWCGEDRRDRLGVPILCWIVCWGGCGVVWWGGRVCVVCVVGRCGVAGASHVRGVAGWPTYGTWLGGRVDLVVGYR